MREKPTNQMKPFSANLSISTVKLAVGAFIKRCRSLVISHLQTMNESLAVLELSGHFTEAIGEWKTLAQKTLNSFTVLFATDEHKHWQQNTSAAQSGCQSHNATRETTETDRQTMTLGRHL